MMVLLFLQAALRLITAMPKVKKRINPYQRAVIAFGIVIFVSVLQAVLVEPQDAVDEAFHTFDGKLPDLVILEGEEPVDALVKWGKEASKVGTEASAKQEDWRPVVREPMYYEILDELCQTDGLNCTRQRAWEFVVSAYSVLLRVNIKNGKDRPAHNSQHLDDDRAWEA